MDACDKKIKIVVVDDEPEMVIILKRFFSQQGYEVMSALTAKEALRILEKESADLLLLDIMMPGVKGSEVARIVKEKYPCVKVIVVSGHVNEAEKLSRDNLSQGTFIKPVNVVDIHRKIKEIFKDNEMPAQPRGESEQVIKARLLLIKAKLLFIEPSIKVYDFLQKCFEGLSDKGERYTLDVLRCNENILEKFFLFNPDIIVINAAFFKEQQGDIPAKLLERNASLKEIVIYNIKNIDDLRKVEWERLLNTIRTICLKKGFMEIQWITI